MMDILVSTLDSFFEVFPKCKSTFNREELTVFLHVNATSIILVVPARKCSLHHIEISLYSLLKTYSSDSLPPPTKKKRYTHMYIFMGE